MFSKTQREVINWRLWLKSVFTRICALGKNTFKRAPFILDERAEDYFESSRRSPIERLLRRIHLLVDLLLRIHWQRFIMPINRATMVWILSNVLKRSRYVISARMYIKSNRTLSACPIKGVCFSIFGDYWPLTYFRHKTPGWWQDDKEMLPDLRSPA